MSLKDNFTTDEWLKVMTGPGQAGAAVVAASPSGLTGLMAEAQAIAQTIRANVSSQSRTPLMEAMAADLLGTPPDPKSLPQSTAKNLEDVKTQALEGVRQAVWLVGAKASPEDAAAYKTMLLEVAEKTAAAAKEGGFLGIGGEQVNDKERAVIEEIKRLIGAATPENSTGLTPASDPTSTQ
ncbi:hypothetical protein [Deinococcus sp.]|uniref:hypothetical protein n=1 Tax=Deinococcus sp. TaxID=47478 RepID=UPI0025C21367|nr:hypothetical protein [Deinococcus sp.]